MFDQRTRNALIRPPLGMAVVLIFACSISAGDERNIGSNRPMRVGALPQSRAVLSETAQNQTYREEAQSSEPSAQAASGGDIRSVINADYSDGSPALQDGRKSRQSAGRSLDPPKALPVDTHVVHTRSIASQQESPLPLAPPSDAKKTGKLASKPLSTGQALFTVVTSLSIVLGAFTLLVWFTRRSLPKGLLRLPPEVLQSLGRAPLDGRQHLQLLKVGNRLLLVSVSSTGSATLTEITDVDEVVRLTALCQEVQPNSISSTFRQVLGQLGKEPAGRGFLGDSPRGQVDSASTSPVRQRTRDHS